MAKKFGIVHTEVLHNLDISLRAKGLYALLCTYADRDRTCFPSISTLSEMSGVSRRTIERTLKELEEHKIVLKSGNIFSLK